MSKKLLALCCALTFGFFSMCYAADAKKNTNEVEKNSKPIQLKDILTTKKSFAPSVGRVVFSTDGTIHFLKAYLYDSTTSDCTGTLTLLGAVSVVDNGAGFPFTNGQVVDFNGDAAYALIQNTGQAITDTDVKCMKFYFSGDNDTDNVSSCVSLPESCSPSTCTTSDPTSQAATWNTSNSGCTDLVAGPTVPVYFYVVEHFGGAVRKCTFTSSTEFDCTDSGVGTLDNAFDVTIDNSYAYVTTFTTGPTIGNVAKCIVNPATGAFSACTDLQINTVTNTSYDGITTNAGHIYVGNSNTVGYSSISPTDGSFLPTANTVTSSFPGGITINNGIAFIQRTPSALSYYVVDPNDGSLSSPLTAASTSVGNLATNNGLAYYTHPSTGSLVYCTNTAGVLSGCTSVGLTSIFPSIQGVQNVIVYNGYAYVTAFNNGTFPAVGDIIACPLNGDGTITGGNCSIATVNGVTLTSPEGMAVY